jgi:hypothetical protein
VYICPVNHNQTTQEEVQYLRAELAAVSTERNTLLGLVREIRALVLSHTETIVALEEPWIPVLREYLDDVCTYTLTGILTEGLGIPRDQQSLNVRTRLGAAMRTLGWKSSIAKRQEGSVRVWQKASTGSSPARVLGDDAKQKLTAYLRLTNPYTTERILEKVFGYAKDKQNRRMQLDLARHLQDLGWKPVILKDEKRRSMRAWRYRPRILPMQSANDEGPF